MELTNKQVAEAFSGHDFDTSFPYLSDAIQWIMPGGENIIGRDNVIQNCRRSKEYLNTVKTNFTKFLVLEAGDHIVIDSISEYRDKEGNVSNVASCDIYFFEQGSMAGITSYCIELNKP